jgi:hypothetical protein
MKSLTKIVAGLAILGGLSGLAGCDGQASVQHKKVQKPRVTQRVDEYGNKMLCLSHTVDNDDVFSVNYLAGQYHQQRLDCRYQGQE